MKQIIMSNANFESIIRGNCIYVDKTKYIHKIISSVDKFFFLSRPRRFGKSLTVSTLRSIFEGKKELFKNLYIENTDWLWDEYPIVQLDFNGIESSNTEILIKRITETLGDIAEKYDIHLQKESAPAQFSELIVKLHKKYNKGVVVLVDEYDKPIVGHLGEGDKKLEIAKENRGFLKAFYDNLKNADVENALKTVFITGVSKFSKVSIFSTLNNLIELDSHPEFSAMLGYTEEELRKYFYEHFEQFAKKHNQSIETVYDNFRYMYNGFRFTGDNIRVYNPFSIGRALNYGRIDNFWFESGTPTFLIKLIKERKYSITAFENLCISRDTLKAYDIEDLQIIPLLFQTGYLTIKDVEGDDIFILSYPNGEVEKGFKTQLIRSITDNIIETPLIYNIKKAFVSGEYEKFFELIKSAFAKIPYTIIPSQLSERELYYHTLFYLMMDLMSDNSLKVYPELLGADTRIDMLIETREKIFIFEFKCNQSADMAILQIREKKYADAFKGKNKPITLVGIDFDSDAKTIKEWKMEEM